MTAECLQQIASGDRDDVFLGHVGGDDFVVMLSVEAAAPSRIAW